MSLSIPGFRSAWRTLAGILVSAAILGGMGLLLVVKDISISSGEIELWIPEDSEERRALETFSDRFGADDMLMVSWEDCDAESDVLVRLGEAITERDREQASETNRPLFFSRVTSYPELRESIASILPEDETLDTRLRERLRGSLIGTGDSTGLLLVEGTDHCAENREEAFALVEETCREVVGPDREFRFAGPLFVSVCSNQETTRTLVFVTPLVAVISLIVALVLLRSPFFAFLSFAVSGLASLVSLAVIHLAGRDLGDMIAVVPSIAQLLAMSNAVHLINYYKEEWLRCGDGERSWRYSLRVGWLPTVAASLTTIIGFAALATSDLAVAKDFAFFGGIGVVSAAVSVLLLVPSALILTRPGVAPPASYEGIFVRFLTFLSEKLRRPVAASLSGLFVLGCIGLGQLRPDVRTETFFSDRSDFRLHFDWFSERFAAPTVTNLMVGFDGEKTAAREQFEFIRGLEERIRSVDSDFGVFSASVLEEVLPPESGAGALPPGARDLLYERLWETAKDNGFVATEESETYWRISIRHPPDPDPKNSAFTGSMNEVLTEAAGELEPAPRFTLTSTEQLFARSQDGLLEQLFRTFLLAFIIVTPIVILFLRSVPLGIMAILGNLFPLAVFFGAMGWLGVRIDIATMMIAAVAFGIAIDDTVHFLTWLGRGFERNTSLSRAIHFAFENCAGAILQTTLIISLGMMAFLLSDFRPSVRFASFSATVLVIALIGDLILLPSLIMCFSRRSKNAKTPGEGEADPGTSAKRMET